MISILFSDFDGVFTNNSVYLNDKGEEFVQCSRADGIGIHALKNSGVQFYVISSEPNSVCQQRANKIGFIAYNNVNNKVALIEKLSAEKGISLSSCAFLGNDINDLSAMKLCGYPIAVNDAYPAVLSISKYITKATGGMGAVREACELIIRLNQQ